MSTKTAELLALLGGQPVIPVLKIEDAAAAVVESVKTASDVYAPLDGSVVEINQPVADDPTIISADPLGRGWLYKLRVANLADLDGFLDEAAYANLIA